MNKITAMNKITGKIILSIIFCFAHLGQISANYLDDISSIHSEDLSDSLSDNLSVNLNETIYQIDPLDKNSEDQENLEIIDHMDLDETIISQNLTYQDLNNYFEYPLESTYIDMQMDLENNLDQIEPEESALSIENEPLSLQINVQELPEQNFNSQIPSFLSMTEFKQNLKEHNINNGDFNDSLSESMEIDVDEIQDYLIAIPYILLERSAVLRGMVFGDLNADLKKPNEKGIFKSNRAVQLNCGSNPIRAFIFLACKSFGLFGNNIGPNSIDLLAHLSLNEIAQVISIGYYCDLINDNFIKEIIISSCKRFSKDKIEQLVTQCLQVDQHKILAAREYILNLRSKENLKAFFLKIGLDYGFSVKELTDRFGEDDYPLNNSRINDLSGLNGLKYTDMLLSLDLGDNELTSLKDNSFNLNKLAGLILSRNKINNIEPETFNNLSNLRVLFLSENKLDKIKQNMFKGLNALETLYLHKNLIREIEQNAFSNLTKLETLRLSDNLINNFYQESLNGLDNLIELDLENNKLTKIDNMFSSLIKLEKLNLKNNEINEIENNAFSSLDELAVLNLSNNKIKTIAMETFSRNLNLDEIDLRSNPIRLYSNKDLLFKDLKRLRFINNQPANKFYNTEPFCPIL